MYTFNWALTAFRSESYIGSATALPDMTHEADMITFEELSHLQQPGGGAHQEVSSLLAWRGGGGSMTAAPDV